MLDPGIADDGQMHNLIHLATITKGSDADFEGVVKKVMSEVSDRYLILPSIIYVHIHIIRTYIPNKSICICIAH